MSRRRGEFEHRTSIFEGAFRAWSHLGGLEPLDLESKSTSDLDPLNFPLENDPRLANDKKKKGGEGGKDRREYRYEPLPRSGLAHPFVQAILSPWLGPDADQDAIQLGLTTLRTWWQHRRKGESGSAIVALGTDKMRGVVEGYTRHFFNLAHCLIVNDKEQPPRTLHGKMRDLEKSRNKKGKKRSREDESIKAAAMAFQSGFGPNMGGGMPQGGQQQGQGGGGDIMAQMGNVMQGGNNMNDANISPLERLHAAQRRQLAESGGVHTNMQGGGMNMPGQIMGGGIPDPSGANIEMKGRCIPGKVDLPGLVQQVSSAATQLAHRGTTMAQGMSKVPSNFACQMNNSNVVDPSKYGDPNITPIVVVTPNQSTGKNDICFLMTIDGITCAHCVKIVETVLKGCNGSRSPVEGLVDAAADQDLKSLLIKISDVSECRRIAFEAARNLSMVGYTAKAKNFGVPGDMNLGEVWSLMERTIPSVAPMQMGQGFQWGYDCQCPDNNVQRHDCPRHSQFGLPMFEVFDKTERLLSELIAGCTKRTGMPCTAGHLCACRSGDVAGKSEEQPQLQQQQGQQPQDNSMYQDNNGNGGQQQQQQQQGANNNQQYMSYQQPIQDSAPHAGNNSGEGNAGMPQRGGGRQGRSSMRMSIGRMSIGGLGGLNETTFGRAMSGLSALSIDWENMDDFDINVDHSAGINNDIINGQQQQQGQQDQGQQQQQQGQQGQGGGQENPNPADENGGYNQYGNGNGGGQMNDPKMARRSSLRKNIPPPDGNQQMASYNVSFNM